MAIEDPQEEENKRGLESSPMSFRGLSSKEGGGRRVDFLFPVGGRGGEGAGLLFWGVLEMEKRRKKGI